MTNLTRHYRINHLCSLDQWPSCFRPISHTIHCTEGTPPFLPSFSFVFAHLRTPFLPPYRVSLLIWHLYSCKDQFDLNQVVLRSSLWCRSHTCVPHRNQSLRAQDVLAKICSANWTALLCALIHPTPSLLRTYELDSWLIDPTQSIDSFSRLAS